MKNLNARPALQKQETSLSLSEKFEAGHWLNAREYALLLSIPIDALDDRRRHGQLSPLVQTERRSGISWFYRKIH